MNGYLQRIALSALNPGGAIQPILDSVFSPPSFASSPEHFSLQTAQPVTVPGPSEFVPQAELRTSVDAPAARALPFPEPAPKGTPSADSVETPSPTSTRLLSPSVPGPKEEPEALIAPRPSAKIGDHFQKQAPKPKRETIVGAAPKQKAEEQTGEMIRRELAESIGTPISTSNRPLTPLVPGPKSKGEAFMGPLLPAKISDQGEQRVPKPRQQRLLEAPPIQKVESRPEELPPKAAIARQDFRTLVAPKSSPVTYGTDRNERMVPPRGYPARAEPDEIQIHIGRIEVVALPPTPAPAASAKPQRWTPSLDEYLRRRDGRTL